ncbi:MAG: polyprenyl synthetase family protein [Bacteroidota bacterium]
MYSAEQLKEIYLNYLERNPFTKAPTNLFEPVDYIMRLGGKRIRPILVLMAYNLFEKEVQQALPIANAIEIFHNFSLVHDDIMDEAPLRRGKPTVHHKYDTNTGILSGDVMLIYAYKNIAAIQDRTLVPDLIDIFNEVAEAVCVGQQYDMDFETSVAVTIPAYLKMIEDKTAQLLVGALKMGAVLAKTSAENVYNLGEFGRNIGIAFQLQDDFLDTFGDPVKFGKRVGGDIVQNKKTYLVLKTLEVANEQDQAELRRLMDSYPEDEAAKIERVKALFTQNRVPSMTEDLMKSFQAKAMSHLDNVTTQDVRKQALLDLASLLLARKT